MNVLFNDVCVVVWVLEVTGCGRRVVVGYCAVNLASIGMRSGLTSDIDTGLLALHLQETAPDQQVSCSVPLLTTFTSYSCIVMLLLKQVSIDDLNPIIRC